MDLSPELRNKIGIEDSLQTLRLLFIHKEDSTEVYEIKDDVYQFLMGLSGIHSTVEVPNLPQDVIQELIDEGVIG
ncbi:hypothetical protein [Alicyclobacillus fastidiosus]|uniref:hypothetical protein n=1 Tax=Alicyclobacillus fastidiosus TaxID=392011 RepID=UPI0023E9DA31|nr:hypothetical protein [Alicyclobacillus fastidiosus]GMA66057.1 hypothetical protein GCM10025859_64990 [Alicyclobacillus fastidiosus]